MAPAATTSVTGGKDIESHPPLQTCAHRRPPPTFDPSIAESSNRDSLCQQLDHVARRNATDPCHPNALNSLLGLCKNCTDHRRVPRFGLGFDEKLDCFVSRRVTFKMTNACSSLHNRYNTINRMDALDGSAQLYTVAQPEE